MVSRYTGQSIPHNERSRIVLHPSLPDKGELWIVCLTAVYYRAGGSWSRDRVGGSVVRLPSTARTPARSVIVTARSAEQVAEVVATITAAGNVAHGVVADITDEGDVAALVARSVALLGGPVDTLINNAGVYKARRFADYELADWEWLLNVNVIATVRVTMAFLPDMLTLDRARIITIASIAGKKGTFGQSAYNASKHAQIGMTRCLALEYGRTGIRVERDLPRLHCN